MDREDADRKLDCFHQMQCEGVPPDAITLICTLKACGILRATPEGHVVQQKVNQEGFRESYNFIGCSLVDMPA